jgi:protein-S-isoprenylcysteine O-methyltransferase Ste14
MKSASKSEWRPAVLDRAEQVLLVIAYVWLLVRIWPNEFDVKDWFPLLLLFSEGLVVFFILVRRRTDTISVRPYDWAIAMSGTFLALAVSTGGEPVIHPALGVMPLMLGVMIHTGAKLSLRRSFGVVAASRGVMVKGMYRFVRHPMYAGYIMSQAGYLLLAPSLRNLLVYLAVWPLLLARIFAEERILMKDAEYREYASRVRSRLIPLVF